MKKKFLYSIPIAAIILGAAQVSAAGNTQDESFSFSFAATNWLGLGGTQYQATSDRVKQDNTSSYMKVNSMTANYSFTGWVEVGSTDESGGNYYTFSSGTTKKLKNYVFENHGPNTSVHIKANLGVKANVSASGVWSPDSI